MRKFLESFRRKHIDKVGVGAVTNVFNGSVFLILEGNLTKAHRDVLS